MLFFAVVVAVGLFVFWLRVHSVPKENNERIQEDAASSQLENHSTAAPSSSGGLQSAQNLPAIPQQQSVLNEFSELNIICDYDDKIQSFDDYCPLDLQTIPEMVSMIPTKNEEILTPLQLQMLRSELKEYLSAYVEADSEKICNNLLHAPHTILPAAAAWHKDVLQNQYSVQEIPNDPAEVFRLLVSKQYGGEGGSGFKGLYNELSPLASSIEFAASSTMPESIHSVLSKLSNSSAYNFKNGFVTLTPSLKYKNSPEKILQSTGNLIYADIRLAVSNSDGVKYSRIKRYYWSDPDNKWLLMEFIILPPSGSKFEIF